MFVHCTNAWHMHSFIMCSIAITTNPDAGFNDEMTNGAPQAEGFYPGRSFLLTAFNPMRIQERRKEKHRISGYIPVLARSACSFECHHEPE